MPQPAAAAIQTGLTAARVVEVVDGDTIKVLIDGQAYSVRAISIGTPETVHPDVPVKWMGPVQHLSTQCDTSRLVPTIAARSKRSWLGIVGEPPPEDVPEPTQPVVGDAGYTCDGCIKGHISYYSGENIYRFPGCPDHEACKINEAKGEQWFSSEGQAQVAGWRKEGLSLRTKAHGPLADDAGTRGDRPQHNRDQGKVNRGKCGKHSPRLKPNADGGRAGLSRTMPRPGHLGNDGPVVVCLR